MTTPSNCPSKLRVIAPRLAVPLVLGFLLLAAMVPRVHGAEPTRDQHSRIIVTSVPPAERLTGAVARYGVTRNDLAAIVDHVPGLQRVVPVREIQRQARFGDRVYEVMLTGTIDEFAQLHPLHIDRGRFLTAADSADLRNVAVIDRDVARSLFQDADPIGKSVRVDDDYFFVIGTTQVQSSPGETGEGDNLRRRVYIPLATMRTRAGDHEIVRRAGTFTMNHFELSRIELVPEDPADARNTAGAVARLLEMRHEDVTFTVTRRVAENSP